MFKIVASFTRINSDHNFFYEDYAQHPVMIQLHNKLTTTSGYLGIFEIVSTETQQDLALGFDTILDFQNFAQSAQDILAERIGLIEEYCRGTGHVYKYYMIENEDKK